MCIEIYYKVIEQFYFAGERPINCTAASWTHFIKECREHIRNPTWNEQQRKASQSYSGPRSKFGSGGARSFAKKFVSYLPLEFFLLFVSLPKI